jgi:hypothetical protein
MQCLAHVFDHALVKSPRGGHKRKHYPICASIILFVKIIGETLTRSIIRMQNPLTLFGAACCGVSLVATQNASVLGFSLASPPEIGLSSKHLRVGFRI